MNRLYNESDTARKIIESADSIIIHGTSDDPTAGHAGLGNGHIMLYELDPIGLGPAHPGREYPFELPSSRGLEIVIGHELGHAVLGLSDPLNVVQVENPIRDDLGVERRETYYGEPLK